MSIQLPRNPDASADLFELVESFSDKAFAGGFLNSADIVGRRIVPRTETRWGMLRERPKMMEALRQAGWDVIRPRPVEPPALEQSYQTKTIRQKIAFHREQIAKLDVLCSRRKFKIGRGFDRADLLKDAEFARLDEERREEAATIKRLNEMLHGYQPQRSAS